MVLLSMEEIIVDVRREEIADSSLKQSMLIETIIHPSIMEYTLGEAIEKEYIMASRNRI